MLFLSVASPPLPVFPSLLCPFCVVSALSLSPSHTVCGHLGCGNVCSLKVKVNYSPFCLNTRTTKASASNSTTFVSVSYRACTPDKSMEWVCTNTSLCNLTFMQRTNENFITVKEYDQPVLSNYLKV